MPFQLEGPCDRIYPVEFLYEWEPATVDTPGHLQINGIYWQVHGLDGWRVPVMLEELNRDEIQLSCAEEYVMQRIIADGNRDRAISART